MRRYLRDLRGSLQPLLLTVNVPRRKALLSWCGAHLSASFPKQETKSPVSPRGAKPNRALGDVDHVTQPAVFNPQDTLVKAQNMPRDRPAKSLAAGRRNRMSIVCKPKRDLETPSRKRLEARLNHHAVREKHPQNGRRARVNILKILGQVFRKFAVRKKESWAFRLVSWALGKYSPPLYLLSKHVLTTNVSNDLQRGCVGRPAGTCRDTPQLYLRLTSWFFTVVSSLLARGCAPNIFRVGRSWAWYPLILALGDGTPTPTFAYSRNLTNLGLAIE